MKIETKEINASLGQGEDSGSIKALFACFNNVDSYGDVILPGAFKNSLKKLETNDIVWLKGHNQENIVGTIKSLYETEEGLVGECSFINTKESQELREMYMKGSVSKHSIGYIKTDYEENEHQGFNIKELDLFEISTVAIPANTSAKVLEVKQNNTIMKLSKKEATEETILEAEMIIDQIDEVEGSLEVGADNSEEIAMLKQLVAELTAKVDELSTPTTEEAPMSQEAKARFIKLEKKLNSLDMNNYGQVSKESLKSGIDTKSMFDGMRKDSSNERFELKAINNSASVSRLPGVLKPTSVESPYKGTVMPLDVIQISTGGDNPVRWMELTAPKAFAGVAEGSLKPEMNMTWVEREAVAKTIASVIGVSRQLYNSYKTFDREVKELVGNMLPQEINRQILEGDGITELNGLINQATAFAYAGNAVPNANLYDVLVAAVAQSRAITAGAIPTHIFLNPSDALALDLIKDVNGNYQLPLFAINESKSVNRVQIVETPFLTAGSFLVGDFSKVMLEVVDQVVLEKGYVNDQFTRNQFSLLTEMFGVLYIKKHQNNFVGGDILAALALMA